MMTPVNDQPVYENVMTRDEMGRIVSSVSIILLSMIFNAVTVGMFGSMGRILIAPASAAMWGFGTFAALWLPSHRQRILKQTDSFILIYCSALFGLRFAANRLNGLSGEMLAASLNLSAGGAATNNMTSIVQNLISVVGIMVPISFMILIGKELKTYRRANDVHRMFVRVRGTRSNGKISGK